MIRGRLLLVSPMAEGKGYLHEGPQCICIYRGAFGQDNRRADFLAESPPRVLSAFLAQPLLLFLDGPFEPDAEVVAGMGGVLQWTKDGFGLGTSRELPGYTRLSMTGGNNETWDLELRDVRLEDDGVYQCQVGATESSTPLRSRYSLVRVMSPPRPPVLTAGPLLTLRQGKVALLQCISKGGKPASVIKWRRNGNLINEGVLEKVEKLNER